MAFSQQCDFSSLSTHWKLVDYRPNSIYYGRFIKISGIDAEDLPKGFEGQRAEKSDEDEGMEDEGQDENRHR